MKTDSVVNLAALAALCGTAGIAGYYNQNRKKERDADKIREVLDNIKEQQLIDALKEQQKHNKEENLMLVKQANFQKEADLRSALMRLVGASGNAASGIRGAGNSFVGALKSLISNGASAGSSAISALKNALGRAGSAVAGGVGAAREGLGGRLFNLGDKMSNSAKAGKSKLSKFKEEAFPEAFEKAEKGVYNSRYGRKSTTTTGQLYTKAKNIANDYLDTVDVLKNTPKRGLLNIKGALGDALANLGARIYGA